MKTTLIGSAVLAVILGALSSACSGGGGSGPSAESNSSVAATAKSTQGLTGHYVGSATIAGVAYFADAVVTQDGAIRLYVGGSYAATFGGQNFELVRPEGSYQFVATLQMRDGEWSGNGFIFGQECAINPANRFCGQPAPAEFSANASAVSDEAITATLQGEIQLLTSGGTETWSLNLGQWFYDGPVEADQYTEGFAEFAGNSNVIVTIDSGGKLFFQSSGSGCVGNGTVASHAAGPTGIYDVTLMIESCSGAYAYLNGAYGGLALMTTSSIWEYDSWLRVWLSTDPENGSPAALTMLSEPL